MISYSRIQKSKSDVQYITYLIAFICISLQITKGTTAVGEIYLHKRAVKVRIEQNFSYLCFSMTNVIHYRQVLPGIKPF